MHLEEFSQKDTTAISQVFKKLEQQTPDERQLGIEFSQKVQEVIETYSVDLQVVHEILRKNQSKIYLVARPMDMFENAEAKLSFTGDTLYPFGVPVICIGENAYNSELKGLGITNEINVERLGNAGIVYPKPPKSGTPAARRAMGSKGYN